MALSEGALKQISECDGASQLEQRLRVVKVFHLMGVLVEQCSGVDRLGNVAQKPLKRGKKGPEPLISHVNGFKIESWIWLC